MADPLSLEEVRHVAVLARLRLDGEKLEEYRSQLSTVLEHISMLEKLDVTDVEPMAHPLDVTNRLAADEVEPSMSVDDLLANAPAVEGRFLAVPKILGEDVGSSA